LERELQGELERLEGVSYCFWYEKGNERWNVGLLSEKDAGVLRVRFGEAYGKG